MIDVFTGGAFQTNGYLVTLADGGRILIDAPEGVADYLRSREYGIELLLLTHLHHDHVVDVAELKRDHDCPVWAHSNPDDDLTLKSVLAASGLQMDLESFEVDRLLAGESEIEIGSAGVKLGVLHVPGHSPDSLCFGPLDLEGLAGTPVLFGGDVLFCGSIGRTDFPHGDHEQLITGIQEKVFTLPDETQVLPGHGPATSVGREKATNPFVAEL